MPKEKSQEIIQKFSWKNHKTYKTYQEADIERNRLLEENKNIKVRRCGQGGKLFVVKVGKPIKTKGEKNATK